MKNLVKGTFFATLFAFVLVACNKDQGCINKLDGTWTVGSMTVHNQTADTAISTTVEGQTSTTMYEFMKFKTKDATNGTMYSTTDVVWVSPLPDTTFSVKDTADYRVQNDCTEFWWQSTSAGSTAMTATISEFSSSSVTMWWDETVGTDTWRYTFTMTK